MAAAERAGTLDEKGKVELAKRRKEMKLLQNKDFTCRDPRQGFFANTAGVRPFAGSDMPGRSFSILRHPRRKRMAHAVVGRAGCHQ